MSKSIVMWQAVIYPHDLLTGNAGAPEILPGLFATSCEAMEPASAVMDARDDVYQVAVRRVNNPEAQP